MSDRLWFAIDAVALPEAREAIEYGLMETGALGTETNESDATVCVTGYYDKAINEDSVRATLLDALRIYGLATSSLIDLKHRDVPDRDWLEEWKKDWRPVEVGRFIIAPPWSEPLAVASDSLPILIEPGMAFGTGTHETTRLCLKSIEKYFRGGSFLDVGTGTGILAIAAAKLFSEARVEACDTDVEAIEIAKENARRNDVGQRINFHVGSVKEQTPSADLVCANLTAPVIIELLPLLLTATCGRLVLSGILDSQIDLVKARLSELGIDNFKVDQDGEWVVVII